MQKWTAGWAVIAFTWMVIGITFPGQLKAGTDKAESEASIVEADKIENSETNSFEKEGASPEIAKKRKSPWPFIVAGALVVGIVVYFTLIKKTKHILSVEVGTGAAGFPGAGKYFLKKGEKVAYSFTCADDYKNLIVLLDGKAAFGSGIITMDRAHTLKVTALQIPDYNLVADIQFGIAGTPTRGTYRFREGTVVPYHYAAADLPLIAKIDGIPVPGSGSLMMDKDRILEVTFGPPPDLRGEWRLILKDDGVTQAKPELLLSLSGKKLKGVTKVIDDPRNNYWSWWWGETGEYEISSIQIILYIYDGGTETYNLKGTIKSSDSITGSYSYVVSDPPYIDSQGTWTATRID